MKISVLGTNGVGKTPLARKMKAEMKAVGVKAKRIRCPYYPGIFGNRLEEFLSPRFKKGLGLHCLYLVFAVLLFPLCVFVFNNKTQIWEHDPGVEVLAYGYSYNSRTLIFIGRIIQAIFPKPDYYILIEKTDWAYKIARKRNEGWSEDLIQKYFKRIDKFEGFLKQSIPKGSLVIIQKAIYPES